MTLSATYASDYSRVRLTFSGYNTDADYALVERSTDGITWTTVRGGLQAPLTAGAGNLDDYEFVNGVLNTYRVSAVDSMAIGNIGTPTVATGNNATVTPTIPTGLTPNVMLLAMVSHRDTATTIGTPAGWTKLTGGSGHFEIFYAQYVSGMANPAFTFSGGSANGSCSATIRAFTNADVPVQLVTQTNTSAQDIALPGAAVSGTGAGLLLHVWKQATSTTFTPPVVWGGSAGPGANTAGSNPESTLSYRAYLQPSVTPGTLTVTGGSAAISKSRVIGLQLRPYTNQETTTITPNVTNFWLKNPSRPGLNIPIEVVSISEQIRGGRTGVFDVIGRTMPVAVSDIHKSRSFTIEIDIKGWTQLADADNRLSTGEPLFLQGPSNSFLPTTYVVIGDYEIRQDVVASDSITISLPMIEVAKPSASVAGLTYLWSDVIANYATWTDVISGNATWSTLIQKISSSIIIVP